MLLTGMFNRHTLFVLGAGASCEVGLPIGSKLAAKISCKTELETDPFDDVERANDTEFANAFLRRFQNEKKQYAKAFEDVHHGVLLTNSIDDFLHIHQDNGYINKVGKAAIVKSILEAEYKSEMYVSTNNIYNRLNTNKVEASWFVKFVRVLGPGYTPEEAKYALDRTSFIVFNYDRCIEHFLTFALHQLFTIPKNDAAALAAEANIIHPYGSIAPLSRVPYGGDPAKVYDYVELATNIKTYTEQLNDPVITHRIRETVEKARCIVFLGFAFHPQNVALIEQAQLQADKQIYGTAVGMSNSDVEIVVNRLRSKFPYGKLPSPETIHIRIDNKLKCAELFDYYAKSLAG